MNHDQVVSLAKKALPCKKCNSQIHIVKDSATSSGIRCFITAHCPKDHFREVGWYTHPEEEDKVWTYLINKWNEANAT